MSILENACYTFLVSFKQSYYVVYRFFGHMHIVLKQYKILMKHNNYKDKCSFKRILCWRRAYKESGLNGSDYSYIIDIY